jgi:16S rRNA (uracil1498-N3)-methyltransferase
LVERRYFHVLRQNIHANRFILDEEEARHLGQVLRLEVGAEIWLLDGEGTAYHGRVEKIGRKTVEGTIDTRYPGYGEDRRDLHLSIGVLKRERLEWAVEKATELGVRSIQPVLFARCVKRSVNRERLSRIAKAAAKQCGRSLIPEIKPLLPFTSWLAAVQGTAVVGDSTAKESIGEWLRHQPETERPISVVIGPEGGFTPEELSSMGDHGLPMVSLGVRRLRSETAAVVALAILNELITNQIKETEA